MTIVRKEGRRFQGGVTRNIRKAVGPINRTQKRVKCVRRRFFDSPLGGDEEGTRFGAPLNKEQHLRQKEKRAPLSIFAKDSEGAGTKNGKRKRKLQSRMAIVNLSWGRMEEEKGSNDFRHSIRCPKTFTFQLAGRCHRKAQYKGVYFRGKLIYRVFG